MTLYTVKTAVTRWQRELPSMGSGELARLGLQAAPVGKKAVRTARAALFRTGTDLNPEQLARHRDMAGRQANQITKNFTQSADPRISAFYSEGGKVKAFRGQRARDYLDQAFPGNPKATGSVQRATLNHEFAERAMQQGQSNLQRSVGAPANYTPVSPRGTNTALKYDPVPYSTHNGPGAVLAENEMLFRDPGARARMRAERSAGSGQDQNVFARLMKQFGATPSSPIPLGGRAHRSLDAATATKVPVDPKMMLERALSGVSRASPEASQAFTSKRFPHQVRAFQERSQNPIKFPEQERQHTGLFSSIRPDSSYARK